MSGLPFGWSLSTLGDVSSHPQYGWTTSANSSGEVRLLRTTDITSGTIDWDTVPFCLEAPADVEKYLLDDGDIVVSRAGSVGKSLLIQEPERSVFASYLIRFRPRINPSFLAYFLTSGAYWKQITEQAAGIALPNINASKLKDVQLPVAPESEQQRIVSKIDELFSRIDEGERALERVQKLVERYRQSVLKAAVSGELTHDWRAARKARSEPVESGEALLARILTARRQAWEQSELAKMKARGIKPVNDNWKKKYKQLASPDITELPELPEGWVFASIEQLCFVDTGATPKRGVEKYYRNGTIDWVTSSAVNEPIIRSSSERITPLAIQETNAKVFPVGSLIVAMYGEGKTRGKVSELGIEAATNQACAALLCGHLDASVRTYVRTFFEKNYAALRAEAAGGVQPNLNLAILKETVIALPPHDEVEAINEETALRLSQVGSIVSEFQSWGNQSSALRQKILSSAFAGKLIPQDPTDEPAATLLERIAAERTAPNTTAPKRGRKKKSA